MAKKWTKKELERLINEFYEGIFSLNRLPREIYDATVETLTDAITRGFGSFDENDLVKTDLFEHFEHNVGAFSAAKTFQQTLDIQKALFKDGFKRPFSDFKKDASDIFDEYNRNWLKTEYRTAYNNAIGARQWLDFQADKDITPLLRYDTANDERVRKEHEELDGIVRHIDDPFWRNWFPPNGWNCRCNVTAHSEDDGLEVTPNAVIESLGSPPKLFDLNPAIDKVIFDPDAHPYFLVADRYKVQAAGNFGLPVKPKPKPIEQKVEPGKLLQRLPFNDHLKNVKAKLNNLLDQYDAEALEINNSLRELEPQLEAARKVQFQALIDLNKTPFDEQAKLKAISLRFAKEEIEDKIDALILKRKALEDPFIDKVVDTLAQDEPLDVNITLTPNQKAAKNGFIEKGVIAFRRIVGKKELLNIAPEITYSSRGSRAYFTQQNNKGGYFGKVSLSSNNKLETVCHELGHWFEISNLAAMRENQAFFNRRTAGLSSRRLKDIYPGHGYRAEERAIEDDFMNAYSGKIYNGAHFETLTMWFTHVLGGPAELRKFLKKDPDHFEHYLRLFYENK